MKLEKFHEWLKLNKNSKKTIDAYFQQINCFGKFYDYKFTQQNLNKYLIKLKDENKSINTINLFKNSMFAYLQYDDIKLEIPSPKRVKRKEIKFYFTEEDMKDVLKCYYDETDLLLRFMFYTGSRSSEIRSVKIENIDFKKRNVKFCNAKGEKDRVIPCLNTQLFQDLEKHCKNKEGKVFNFSQGQLQYLFQKIKKDLEINQEEVVEPRTMRISFVKYCINKKLDLFSLKKLMGHTDIKVTEMYAEPNEKQVKDACEIIRTGRAESDPKDEKINNLEKIIKGLKVSIKNLNNIIKSLKEKFKGEK